MLSQRSLSLLIVNFGDCLFQFVHRKLQKYVFYKISDWVFLEYCFLNRLGLWGGLIKRVLFFGQHFQIQFNYFQIFIFKTVWSEIVFSKGKINNLGQ